MSIFVLPVRVYYEDTDAGGVVYYANYLKFMERARTEWLRDLGFSHVFLQNTYQIAFVMKKITLDYRKPAHLDDMLTLHGSLYKYGKASLTMHQAVKREDEILCQGEVKLGCINTQTFKPQAMPAEILTKLNPDV